MASHRSLSVALCQSKSEICWIPRWKPSPRVPSYVAFATHTDFVDELSSIAFVFHSILSWQPQSMLWEACQHVTKAFEHSSSRELWSSCPKQPSMETSKRISTYSKCMKYSFYFAKNNGMEMQLLISWREDCDWLTLEDQETGCSSELTRLICFQYWKKREKKSSTEADLFVWFDHKDRRQIWSKSLLCMLMGALLKPILLLFKYWQRLEEHSMKQTGADRGVVGEGSRWAWKERED